MTSTINPSAVAAMEQTLGDTIGELFSRDPEAMTDSDLDRIIAEMREHRKRVAEAEEAGRRPQAIKVSQIAQGSPEDAGL